MSTLGDSATIRTIQQYLWLLWLKKRLDLNENGRISELFADRNRFLTLEPTLKNGLLIIRKRTVFTEKFCPEKPQRRLLSYTRTQVSKKITRGELPAEFIILTTQFLIFDTQFLVVNTNFFVVNTNFFIFTHCPQENVTCLKLPRLSLPATALLWRFKLSCSQSLPASKSTTL